MTLNYSFNFSQTVTTLNYDEIVLKILETTRSYYYNQHLIILIFVVIAYLMIDQRKRIWNKFKILFPKKYRFGIFWKRDIDFKDIYFIILQLIIAIIFIVITTLMFSNYGLNPHNL